MEKTLNDKLRLLDIENLMFTLFIIASLIDINANEKLRGLYNAGKSPSEDIRDDYVYASYLILLVFVVFMLRNLDNLKYIDKNTKEYELAKIRLFGSVLIVTGQVMNVYYFENTTIFNNKKS